MCNLPGASEENNKIDFWNLHPISTESISPVSAKGRIPYYVNQ